MTGKALNPHAAKVLQWRESLSTLQDHHFFEIIRMYLGEIKTPYNKQKLIEELSAFIRRDENKKAIVQLLSESDRLILSAIQTLPFVSQEKIVLFFTGTFPLTELYDHILNLEERLLLYRYSDPISSKIVFAINPLLIETLEPYIHQSLLLPEGKIDSAVRETQRQELSAQLIASLFTFVSSEPGLCKADGTFKKKIETMLYDIFPQVSNISFLQRLIQALKNLSLFKMEEGSLNCDYAKWRQFAELDEEVQYAYITASARSHLPRDILQQQAQLLIDITSRIRSTLYTKKTLLRCALLLKEKALQGTETRKHGRFASILQQSSTTEHRVEESSTIDIIEDAIYFGLIQVQGLDDEDEPLYSSVARQQIVERVQTLSIDAGYSVTILPGMSLKQLLPLVHCMTLKRCDTILQMEITRQSCMKCFDSGSLPETIFTDLDNATNHQVSKNLHISIEEWFKSFTSASLYRGYVLQVSPEKQIQVEKNPEIAPYIKYILTTGIYLMDFASDEEAHDVITRSGLDFIGGIKTLHQTSAPLPFVNLKSDKQDIDTSQSSVQVSLSSNDKKQLQTSLREQIDTMNCTPEQKEVLRSRIQRKIIINPVQLRSDSVRMEKTEASGMDFLGKIHVIEYAISTNSMIEFYYEETGKNKNLIIGKPISIDKHVNDAIVTIKKESDNTLVEMSIAQASLVKRIRGSIFKEQR